jgi:protein CpxP
MLATMLLATGQAFAQAPASSTPAPVTPAATSPAPASEKGSEGGARVDQRITQMHQRLKITPAQETSWDAFTKVMRDNVAATEEAYKERRGTIATMSAPDNMRNFAQIEQARAQGVQSLAASFQTLYDGMSDDQKKTADAMFRNYEEREHGAAHNKGPK